MRPTVITDLSDEDPAMLEEIFGPVTCVVPFDDDQEVSQANVLLEKFRHELNKHFFSVFDYDILYLTSMEF